MIQQLPSFKFTSWKKFLFLVCFVLATFFNGNAQNYVDVSLNQIISLGGEEQCPPKEGFVSDFVINPSSGMSGIGIGWGANLYLNSEVGSANTIYDLSWILGVNMTYKNVIYTFDNLDIWMYEYTGAAFSNTTRPDVQTWSSGALPSGVSNLVKVVSNGKLVVKDVGMECIASSLNALDIPYNYSGNNSLVIYLEKKTPAKTDGPSSATPCFKQNSRENAIRRLCNWEGTMSNPLNSNSLLASNSAKKFARVVFNRVKANRQVNKSCSTTEFIGDCYIPVCTPPVISNKPTSICSNTVLNFSPTATGTDVIPSGTSYKWTFTDNPKVTGEANETSGKTSITSNLINTTNTPQDVVYTVTPSSATCVGTPFTLTVTVNPQPVIADITKSLCSGGILDFSPLGIAPNIIPTSTTYTWIVTPPAGITGATSESSSQSRIVQYLTNSTNNPIDVVYNFVATSGTASNLCSNTFKITVTVKPKPAIPTLGNPIDPTCYSDGSVLISGLPVVTLPKQWTLKSTAKYNFTTTGNTATYNYTSLKSNNKIKFIVELDGCKSDSTAELIIASVPGKPFIEGPSSVCLNSEITLKAWTDNTKATKSTPSATSPWSLKDTRDNDTVSLTNGTDPSVTSSIVKGLKSASSTKPAEVVLLYTDMNGCISDYLISINSIPTLTLMNTGNGVCIGSQMVLKASIPGGVWTCLTPQFANLSFNYLYPKSGLTGLNTVELKYQLDQKNCNASIIEYVKIYPLPKIVGNSTSICVGDTTTFKDIANREPLNEKTIWSLIDNSIATINQDGLLRAIKDGSSEVLGKNVFGCTSQSYVKIRPTALFDDTTIYVCSGVEKSFIPLFKNSSKQLNTTLKWSVVTTNSVDGENEMQTLVPAFKQTLTNKSGNDQTLNYLLSSSVGTGTDACLSTRILNVIVSSALDIVGPSNIDLGNQVQYTSLNKSDKTLKWSTSNPQVIMVNNTGMLASKGMGSAILSVTNASGCSAEMNVNVTQNQKIKGLNYVCEGSQITLSGFDTPKTVDPWTSSNSSILTINTVGQVTGLKTGKSLVSYFNDQGQKDTMTVFVRTTPVVDLIQDYNICPGYFADGIKFNGTMGALFDWKNNNRATGLSPEGIQQISPFDAINNGITNLISEITVTPRLGECLGASKKFNIHVRFIPRIKITQIDTVVCTGGNINFKTELTPAVNSPIYQWTVNGVKVGVNSSVYWSNTLKSNDKIMVNLSGKDFCPTSENLIVRMDSLRLSMQLPSMLYVKAPVLNLVGYPVGGTFSGKGITTNKLDPSVVGVGTKLVTYSFKNTNNCSGEITQKVLVYDTVSNNCHVTTYDTVKVLDTVSVLKVKFKLTTGIKANQETTIRVFPNPTSDILRIEVTDEKAMVGYAYKIIDASGKVVYNQLVKAAVTEIPLKTLGAVGAYFLEVLDENFKIVVTKKIILE